MRSPSKGSLPVPLPMSYSSKLLSSAVVLIPVRLLLEASTLYRSLGREPGEQLWLRYRPQPQGQAIEQRIGDDK